MHHCSCLNGCDVLIKDAEICKPGEILIVSSKYKLDFPPMISMRVDDKIRPGHLHTVLLVETKYSCTGKNKQFPEIGKGYCKSCIKLCNKHLEHISMNNAKIDCTSEEKKEETFGLNNCKK